MWTTQGRCPHIHSFSSSSQIQFDDNEKEQNGSDCPYPNSAIFTRILTAIHRQQGRPGGEEN
jgi:hypothetical protein